MYTLEDAVMLIKEDAASCNILWEEKQVQVQIVVRFCLIAEGKEEKFHPILKDFVAPYCNACQEVGR